jgi:hypothetical protein
MNDLRITKKSTTEAETSSDRDTEETGTSRNKPQYDSLGFRECFRETLDYSPSGNPHSLVANLSTISIARLMSLAPATEHNGTGKRAQNKRKKACKG